MHHITYQSQSQDPSPPSPLTMRVDRASGRRRACRGPGSGCRARVEYGASPGYSHLPLSRGAPRLGNGTS